MRHRACAVLIVSTIAVVSARGQAPQLLPPPGSVTPGTSVNVTLSNTTASTISWVPNVLHALSAIGDLVQPFDVQSDFVEALSPGMSTTLPLFVPASGPGSNGSFLLLFSGSIRAVARLDVGTPSSSFLSLHAYPQRMHRRAAAAAAAPAAHAG